MATLPERELSRGSFTMVRLDTINSSIFTILLYYCSINGVMQYFNESDCY